MAKLDYKEQYEETEEEIRAREAKNKVKPQKETGRSVYEVQRQIKEKSEQTDN